MAAEGKRIEKKRTHRRSPSASAAFSSPSPAEDRPRLPLGGEERDGDAILLEEEPGSIGGGRAGEKEEEEGEGTDAADATDRW